MHQRTDPTPGTPRHGGSAMKDGFENQWVSSLWVFNNQLGLTPGTSKNQWLSSRRAEGDRK